MHGDVKAANVLMATSGMVKLADFGCSKRITGFEVNASSEDQQHTAAGTTQWMVSCNRSN